MDKIKMSRKLLLFLLLMLSVLFINSTGSSAIEFGTIRVDIENDDVIDSILYSSGDININITDNVIILGDKIVIPWSFYTRPIHYFSVVSSDGTVNTSTTTISPTTVDSNSTTVVYKALSNGNILIYWSPSSSGQGLADTYFKIVDTNFNEVKAATKILKIYRPGQDSFLGQK